MNYAEIQSNLNQFIGTMEWHPIFVTNDMNITMTDGVKYFVEKCGKEAKYIIMDILKQSITRNLINEWQFIHINVEPVDEHRNKVTMYSEPDLNEPHFWDLEYESVKDEDSMPTGEYKIWFQNSVLLLPSEY